MLLCCLLIGSESGLNSPDLIMAYVASIFKRRTSLGRFGLIDAQF